MPAGPPLGSELLHQALEGNLLVGVGLGDGGAQARHHLAQARVAAEIGPQDQRIDEKADQPFRLQPGAAGDRGGEGEVVLLRETSEKGGEDGGPGHEGRPALLPRQLPQPVRRGFRQDQRRLHRMGGGGGRAFPVLQQLQRGQAGETPPPEVEIRGQLAGGQALLLPGRVVRVLEGELGRGDGRPAAKAP